MNCKWGRDCYSVERIAFKFWQFSVLCQKFWVTCRVAYVADFASSCFSKPLPGDNPVFHRLAVSWLTGLPVSAYFLLSCGGPVIETMAEAVLHSARNGERDTANYRGNPNITHSYHVLLHLSTVSTGSISLMRAHLIQYTAMGCHGDVHPVPGSPQDIMLPYGSQPCHGLLPGNTVTVPYSLHVAAMLFFATAWGMW